VVETGIDHLSNGKLLFIPCSRETLLTTQLIPPGRAVLQVPGCVTLDAPLLRRLAELRQAGCLIALDNFRFDESRRAALVQADYVRLDVRGLTAAQLNENAEILRRFPVQTIATRVESETELQRCRRLGIELFQGCYLRKPDTIRSTSVPANQFSALYLVAECQKPNITLQQVATIISRDVALAWGLLRLANTLLYSGSAPVETLTQAVARLGIQKVMRWALLLTVAANRKCPTGYAMYSLQRAFMCEQIARVHGSEHPDTAFLVGLLSLLDSILDVPMATLLRQLPVSAKIRGALLHGEGPAGGILEAVLTWERGAWEGFLQTGIAPAVAQEAWLFSLERSAETMRSLLEIGTPEPPSV
jgi:EAL and modified HD-GYP domain-containing signal transduction protein